MRVEIIAWKRAVEMLIIKPDITLNELMERLNIGRVTSAEFKRDFANRRVELEQIIKEEKYSIF